MSILLCVFIQNENYFFLHKYAPLSQFVKSFTQNHGLETYYFFIDIFLPQPNPHNLFITSTNIH